MSRTVLFVQEMDGQNWHILNVQRTTGPQGGSWWIAECGAGAGNAPYRLRAGTIDMDGHGSFVSYPAEVVPLDVCPMCVQT